MKDRKLADAIIFVLNSQSNIPDGCHAKHKEEAQVMNV
jgi:hypothetical protein